MFSSEIGIDLGSANTVVIGKRRGIIAREPSVVAINRHTRAVLAVGNEARQMIGRTPDTIIPIQPIRGGAISDLKHTAEILKHMIRKIAGSRWLRPRVFLTVQTGANVVDRRALTDAATQAGAGQVSLVDEAVAAALGAGLPVNNPFGNLLVHVGSGCTTVVVISLGRVVVSTTCPVAGELLDELVTRYMRREHNLLIGPLTAERVKMGLAGAMASGGVVAVSGRLLMTGCPAQVKIPAMDINLVMNEALAQIEHAIHQVLGQTPPELLADIAQTGLMLTGGGALLYGLPELIHRSTGLTVSVAEEPLEAVARGTASLLEDRSQARILGVQK